MEDRYLPTLAERKRIVLTQIGECQTLIYRNKLENFTFKEKKDTDKMLEVETNNNILKRKLNHLFREWERLNKEGADEDRGDTSFEGANLQPNPRGTSQRT